MSEPRSVLLVEDEWFLAADLEEALTGAGFATDVVSSGEEALTLFMEGAINYRVLVTDVRLPGSVNGWEVARRIRESDPAFPVVYVTSAPATEWALHGVPDSILLSKPFTRARVVTTVANLLNVPPTA